MNMRRASAVILISALVVPFPAATAAPPKGLTVLRCGRLIDGKRAVPIEGAVVVVEGEAPCPHRGPALTFIAPRVPAGT